jgi:hypothetical protein
MKSIWGNGLLVALFQVAAVCAFASELDFPTRVLPILTKAGCNAGACHGAGIGQAGFKLSLLGYDPHADHDTLTRELSGRRIDLASPADSLILRKATRSIRHKGGHRLDVDSDDYRTLIAWIEGGAAYGPADLRVRRIDVSPSDVLLGGPGQSVRLKVTATLSDGTRHDVTGHALYDSNDEGVVEADADGRLTVVRRGPTAVMVRYGGQVAAVRVAAPFRDAEVPGTALTSHSFIDDKVFAELRRLRVSPSPVSGDAEFLRRVYLDVIGRLPTVAQSRAFLADNDAGKRLRVIDELVRGDDFTDVWTLRLADLLLIDSKRLGAAQARAYHSWLRRRVAQNVPLDRLVRDLMTTVGDAATEGPANFHRLTQDPRDMGEYVGGALLGVRIACARCHAHPFDAWTQDDYYGFAAYFARTMQEGGRVILSDRGEVQHPKTQKNVAPKPLGAAPPALGDVNRLASLAQWTTSPSNPYFARNMVNRVWRHLLGRGIVEPVDDVRVTNPPSNPALLDALAADFIASGHDLRHLVRTIVASATYQLSSRPTDDNRLDDHLFSHAYPRPLAAQVLADAIAQATGVADAFPDYPPGTRAVQLIDARTPSEALDVLGRCTRDLSCETQSRGGGGISQALHLMNGLTINPKLRGGLVDQVIREKLSDRQAIEELFLRTLCRVPSGQELTFCERSLSDAAAAKREAIEDLLWTLLNSREFVYNH